MTELLLLALLGGLLALENTSVGQFMVSRPLVAGTLTGWLMGSAAAGFAVGTILEIYLLVSLPVGASRYPEGGLATVIAAAVALPAGGGMPGAAALAVGVAFGLVWGQLGGITVTLLRRVNGRLAPAGEGAPVGPGRVVGAHAAGMGLDLLRATVVTGTGIWAGRAVLDRVGDAWPLGLPLTRQLLLLGALVSLGILLKSFGATGARWPLAAGGLAAGLLLGWVVA